MHDPSVWLVVVIDHFCLGGGEKRMSDTSAGG